MAPTITIDLDAQEVMSPDLVEPLIEPVQDTVLVGSDRVVDGCPVAVREAVSCGDLQPWFRIQCYECMPLRKRALCCL